MGTVTADDLHFRQAVEACTLAADDFKHEQHVRLAWIYLQCMTPDEAGRECGRTIRRFATHHGAPAKYHETMTLAFVRIIHSRAATAPPGEDWPAFRSRVPEVIGAARRLLDHHYSPDALADDTARRRFVPPDRQPF